MQINIETMMPWGPPKEVQTRMGKRILRTAPVTEDFWKLWRSGKAELKAAGISCSPDSKTGQWTVCWWFNSETPEQAAAKNQAVAQSRATDANIDIPAPEGLAYLPFQKAGIAFMRDREGILLADDMGLGKTVQSIGLINIDPTIKKVLIVCPASLKVNWRNELNRWLVRPLVVGIQSGGEKWVGSTADVVVINYDLLSKFPQLHTTAWDLLVADEAHFVKNRKAKRTKLLLGAKDQPGIQARRRVFATGTPILNKPVEIFPLLQSLQPNDWTFKDMIRYCAGYRGRYGWDFTGAAYLDEFQLRLRSTLMVRRLKSEVLTELPPKRRQVIEMGANGSSNLVEQERAAWEKKEEAMAEAKAEAMMAHLDGNEVMYKMAVDKLKKAQAVAFTEISYIRHEIALAKVDKVVEHVTDVLEDTKKVVLFAHHIDVIEAYRSALVDYGALVINGETKIEERQNIVTQFNTGKDRVLILGIHAAGVGLSVKASVEIFAELDWVPGIISQAEDRCYGVGRGIEGEPLLVQHLVLEGSLDARMAKVIVHKQDVADRALDKNVMVAAGSEPVTTLDIDLMDLKADAVSKELHDHVHLGLRMLAGICDGAKSRDDMGFNGRDTSFGKAMAKRPCLSDKMVWIGVKMVMFYRRQLGKDFDARTKELVEAEKARKETAK